MTDRPSGPLAGPGTARLLATRIVLTGVAGFLLAAGEAAAQIGSGWTRSKEIRLNTSSTGAGIATLQAGYPVPVLLNAVNFEFDRAKDDGSDIRFTQPDGSPLPHEIEWWSKAERKAAVWVRVDVQGNSASQAIRMHWGNPAAANASDGKLVFAPADGWVAAWHLGDDGDSARDAFKDATGQNHGTGHRMEKGNGRPGRMGRAANLEHLKKQGVKVVENRKNFDLAKNITFSIWGFWRSFGYDRGYESFMTKGDESWRYMRANKTKSTEICSDGMSPVCVFGKTQLVPGSWYHFAGVHDGRAVRLYINGAREAAGNAGGDHVSFGDHAVTLGFSLHKGVEQRFMDMIIDEARVTKDSKTDDWIKLEWQGLKEGSTFLDHGEAAAALPRRTLPGWIGPAPERRCAGCEAVDALGRRRPIDLSSTQIPRADGAGFPAGAP